jgi:hypothetical protein
MRAVTVYRREDSSNSIYPTRHPIGSVLELRIYEWVNNHNDLLRLARRLFALDMADALHIGIDVSQARRTTFPDRRGSFEETTSFRRLGA